MEPSPVFTAGHHARIRVTQCPWYTAWEKRGLLNFGAPFCRDIDTALVRGFNPGLTLEVASTRTTGGACCDLLFKDANLTPLKILGLLAKKKLFPGKLAVMPWEYHTGHDFNTLPRTLP